MHANDLDSSADRKNENDTVYRLHALKLVILYIGETGASCNILHKFLIYSEVFW